MDFNVLITAIGSLGFPIIACLCLGWYVKYQTDNNNKTVGEMQKEHKEEIKKVTEALQNNTIALQKLCDKLDAEEVMPVRKRSRFDDDEYLVEDDF